MSLVNTGETIQARRNRLSSVPRACEGCKIRKVKKSHEDPVLGRQFALRAPKIRCDRTTPCANCQASNITCRHPNVKPKSQLQADKVANFEGIIRHLERRLQSVESRLAALEPSQPVTLTEDSENLDVLHPDSSSVQDGHPFEGTSSFTNQSLEASESAQMASLSTAIGDDSAIDHSLHQLRNAVSVSHSLAKCDYFFHKSVSQLTRAVHPLPVTLVACILRRMRVHRPIFLSSYAISDLSLMEKLCQRVFFQTDSASVSDIASVHGVLFFVLKELISMKDQLSGKFDLVTYLDYCEQNFITAIETYKILAVPSFENILALTMGMLKAQGEGKPYLYWNLVSAAVTHCQSLGYHRESTYLNVPSSQAENIRRLFWTVYTFDKNMSLVLGRASNMQSVEIDTRHPAVSADVALRAWDESFIKGINLAELQGRILVGLYSNVTMARDSSERTQLISDLAVAMGNLHSELKQINPEGVNNPQVYSLSRGNWDILFYSTLTLLFRASSTIGAELRISSDCFNAARNSLRAHLNFFPQYQKSQLLSDGEYFNWILLSSSFVPFIVTFLHAVAAKDVTDVMLLEQVLGTLENFRNSSPGSKRLYQICSKFTQVARKLVKSEQSHMGIYCHQQDSLEFPGSSHRTSLFYPDIFADAFGPENMNYVDPSYATDILDGWLSGPPFPWDKLDN